MAHVGADEIQDQHKSNTTWPASVRLSVPQAGARSPAAGAARLG